MNMEITELWPTPVWFGQMPIENLAERQKLADPSVEIDITALHLPGSAILENAAATIGPPHTQLDWHHRLVVWQPGYHLGMSYTPAAVKALVIVTSNAPENRPESGLISLHDPRAGAPNVALPGLPWGRAAKAPPIEGLALAHPGWLGCSIAPLRRKHSITVWIAEATPAR